MSRLIDADKIGLTDFEIVMCGGSYKNALVMLIDKITNAPAVDAVPIVRCKECKHRPKESEIYPFIEFPDAICLCQCDDYYYSWMPSNEWFCPRGEREEE